MERVNLMRLESMVNNYAKILNDLEEDYILYSDMKKEDKYFKQVSNSFRGNINDLYIIIEDYIAFSLNLAGICLLEISLKEHIENAYKLKLIPKYIYDFYNKTLDNRKILLYQDKNLGMENLVKLYKSNKRILNNFEEFLDNRLKNCI